MATLLACYGSFDSRLRLQLLSRLPLALILFRCRLQLLLSVVTDLKYATIARYQGIADGIRPSHIKHTWPLLAANRNPYGRHMFPLRHLSPFYHPPLGAGG